MDERLKSTSAEPGCSLEDLMEHESDVEPHSSGFKLHQPSQRTEKRYECIRCGKVHQGPKMVAVRYGTSTGVCWFCCSVEEEKLGLALPTALAMRPRAKGKQTAASELGARLAASPTLVNRQSVHTQREEDLPYHPPTQKPCATCKSTVHGGLQPSKLNVGEKVCGVCISKELKTIMEAFK